MTVWLGASGKALCFARNLSPELSSPDTLLAIDFDPGREFCR